MRYKLFLIYYTYLTIAVCASKNHTIIVVYVQHNRPSPN